MAHYVTSKAFVFHPNLLTYNKYQKNTHSNINLLWNMYEKILALVYQRSTVQQKWNKSWVR